MIAAAAMALSSISVVLNAARLNRYTPLALPSSEEPASNAPQQAPAAPDVRSDSSR